MLKKLPYIFFATALMIMACSAKENTAAETQTSTEPAPLPQQNDLPQMTLSLSTGDQLEAKNLKGNVILILFQPECDHCQNEARQIKSRLQAFSAYKLFFISSAPMEEIVKFAKTYELMDVPGVTFASTPGQSVLDNYGPIAAPSIYIYNKEGKLVQGFNGEMEIDVVIKYL